MSAAYPRDDEPITEAEAAAGLLMVFQIVAIIAGGLLLGFLLRWM